MPSVVPKVISSSFKGRNLALSQSLIATGGFLGAMSGTMFSATFFSPLLGGWRNSVFLYGLPIIIVGILWMTRARTPPTAAVSNIESGIPIKESLSHIIRVKRIWVIGLMSLCMGAAYVGLSGYLALYLRKIGWEPASADLSVTLLIACTAAGSIPLILLAYRLGSHKNMILWGHIVMAIATGLLSIAGDSTIWVLVTVIGLIWGAVNPIYIVLALETREVGTRYAGTALGLLSMISMAGGFVSPPLGNSLATINPGFPFLFWAALYLVALPGFAFLKDEVRVTNTSRS
jgi:Na+/melibiose symporter-like transporter